MVTMPPPRPKNIGRFTTETPPSRPDFLTDEIKPLKPKPKIDPKFLVPLKERVSPEEARQISKGEEFGDMEYTMETLPEFISPIGRLGFSPSKTTVDFIEHGVQPTAAGRYSPEEDTISYIDMRDDKSTILKNYEKDTDAKRALLTQGSFANPKNFVIEHESIHRGLYLLHQYWEDDADGFIKKYGEEAWSFLQKAAPINMKRTYDILPYIEAISTLNDGIRSIKNDPSLKGNDTKFQYDRYMAEIYPDVEDNRRILNKIFNQALEVLPELEEAAIDRLIDEDSEGVFDDAQNMPEVKAKRKGAMGRLLNKLKFAYRNYKSEKDMQPIYEEASKNMPDEFAKGGMAMDKQMKMAFMDNGGLQDDGMDRDPVSGNDVPSGSLAEEVRDDIPAQLSEGEYVVPADVVRFFGVKFFEDLRMQAKMGLAQMERSGRIGGEPIEDDGEMMDSDDEALIIAMTPDMNKGGVVRMAEGGLTDEEKEAAGLIDGRYPQPYRDTLRDYSFVGSSLFSPRGQDDVTTQELTEETWYHPDGRSMTIMRNADGAVVPASDSKFTQAPWSTSKPEEDVEDTKVDRSKTSAAHERAEDRARQLKDAERQLAHLNKIRASKGQPPLKNLPGPLMSQDWYKNRKQSSVKLATNPDGSINYDKVLTDNYGQIAYYSEDSYNAIEKGFNKDKDTLEKIFGSEIKNITMNEYHKMSFIDKLKINRMRGKEITPEIQAEMDAIAKTYVGEDGKFKGADIINPLASKAAGFVAEKLRGKDVYAGGEYISPKQQELIEFLYMKQAQVGDRSRLNKTEQDQLNAFEKIYGKDGIKFTTESGDTRFSSEFKLPETPVATDNLNETSSNETNNDETPVTPTFVPPKAGSDLSGGSTKAAETTMKIAQQGKETKAEKQARQDRIKKAQDRYKAQQQKDKDEKNVDQKIAGQITGKGYTGGSGFTKGGLASKPQPKPKKKRTTKGLGTKPKAT